MKMQRLFTGPSFADDSYEDFDVSDELSGSQSGVATLLTTNPGLVSQYTHM